MRFLICLLGAVFLSACSYITPHKIEVQQGNLVTQESFARVKVGMNKKMATAIRNKRRSAKELRESLGMTDEENDAWKKRPN